MQLQKLSPAQSAKIRKANSALYQVKGKWYEAEKLRFYDDQTFELPWSPPSCVLTSIEDEEGKVQETHKSERAPKTSAERLADEFWNMPR